MKVLKKITTISDRIIGLFGLFAALLIIFMLLAINFQVVMRFVAGKGLLWILEFATYSLLYIAFLGSAWLLKSEGHVKMDLVLTRLKPRTQAALNVVTSIFGIIISLVLIWFGVGVTWEHFQEGYYIKSVIEPPTWPLLAVIPVGSFLLFIQFLRRTYGYVREWRTTPDKDQTHK
jgi:TRAP-type C4-dicarboxylate transport system permease small subunit